MRAKPPEALEKKRISINGRWETTVGSMHGAFLFRNLKIISSGERSIFNEWEHVSVSHRGRCPSWEEMRDVKDLFWAEDECVVQFHPPKSEYVNIHPYVLHLWKPPYPIELPPTEQV